MDFCKVFDELMTSRGLSNYQLSKDTGISDSLIGYWRTGKRKPSLENLVLLTDYFKISIDELVFGKKNISILFGNESLNPDEEELIATYNKLDRRGQHRIHTVIYEELDRMKEEL